MVGENLEFYFTHMAEIAFKLMQLLELQENKKMDQGNGFPGHLFHPRLSPDFPGFPQSYEPGTPAIG